MQMNRFIESYVPFQAKLAHHQSLMVGIAFSVVPKPLALRQKRHDHMLDGVESFDELGFRKLASRNTK